MWELLSSRPSPRHLPGWDWESGWESWFTSATAFSVSERTLQPVSGKGKLQHWLVCPNYQSHPRQLFFYQHPVIDLQVSLSVYSANRRCQGLPVPNKSWRVQSDPEDVAIEVNQLSQPLSQSQAGKWRGTVGMKEASTGWYNFLRKWKSYYHYLIHPFSGVLYFFYDKVSGLSIRCVRD